MIFQVSVSFSQDEVRPGKQVKLTLKAAANSRVCVSAVDKSVYLLRSGNELTEDRVSSKHSFSYEGKLLIDNRETFPCH